MSYLIILTGIPASGKTTFSKYLSKELRIPVISKDFIKEILFDDLGFQSRAEKVQLGVASMNIMYGLAEESMKIGVPVILENNFENSSKEKLIELIDTYGYKVINIRFEGDISKIYDRFVKRDLSEERHIGHVTNQCYPPVEPFIRTTALTLENFENMVVCRGIRDFDIGSDIIHVDSTDLNKINYSEIINEVKDKIERLSIC
jgi:predicted kinase